MQSVIDFVGSLIHESVVPRDTTFSDLGLDSTDLDELCVKFNVSIETVYEFDTVSKLSAFIAK